MVKYIVVIALIPYLLKLSGFCFSEGGWKSSRELIEAAFEREIARDWPRSPAFSDYRAFLAEYPQCCYTTSGGPFLDGPSLILNALFGRRFYAVTIKYPAKDVPANDGEPFYEAILIMDCCGKDVVDRFGIVRSTPVPKGPPVKIEKVRRN